MLVLKARPKCSPPGIVSPRLEPLGPDAQGCDDGVEVVVVLVVPIACGGYVSQRGSHGGGRDFHSFRGVSFLKPEMGGIGVFADDFSH